MQKIALTRTTPCPITSTLLTSSWSSSPHKQVLGLHLSSSSSSSSSMHCTLPHSLSHHHHPPPTQGEVVRWCRVEVEARPVEMSPTSSTYSLSTL